MAAVTEAHALRGAAGRVGASRLAAVPASLEAAAVGGKPTGLAADEITAAAAATIDEIKAAVVLTSSVRVRRCYPSVAR